MNKDNKSVSGASDFYEKFPALSNLFCYSTCAPNVKDGDIDCEALCECTCSAREVVVIQIVELVSYLFGFKTV